MTDRHRFHDVFWKGISHVIKPFIAGKFNATNEELYVDGPCIIISNHVTDWDPLLVGASFPKKQLYFVASEHIFRLGFVSKLIEFFLAPIPRRKASMGTDTVMSCLRHLKAGHSICLFAEGDASWDGLTHEVFPATGKLVRNSGASLVTYRLEGAFLSKPRWSKKFFKGRCYGHPVTVYSPQQLKAMTPAQITAAINADIYENAWERQKKERVRYSPEGLADDIDKALFLCPCCGKIGTIRGENSRIFCTDCGFETFFDEYRLLSPAEPFENIAQWDKWQHENISLPEGDETAFSDDDINLKEIFSDHRDNELADGTLSVRKRSLCIRQFAFALKDIPMMAMVQKKAILFSHDGKYYELKCKNEKCMRKYLAVWKKCRAAV